MDDRPMFIDRQKVPHHVSTFAAILGGRGDRQSLKREPKIGWRLATAALPILHATLGHPQRQGQGAL
jgi:hypothetical protein